MLRGFELPAIGDATGGGDPLGSAGAVYNVKIKI
jgi:hypothetical protein